MVHVVPQIASHDIIVHEQSSTQWFEHSPCENQSPHHEQSPSHTLLMRMCSVHNYKIK